MCYVIESIAGNKCTSFKLCTLKVNWYLEELLNYIYIAKRFEMKLCKELSYIFPGGWGKDDVLIGGLVPYDIMLELWPEWPKLHMSTSYIF